MSRLGAFLVQEGILTAADRQIIKRESAAYHGSFARSVLAMGLLDEDELSALMATKTGCAQVAKNILHDLDPAVAGLVPLHVLTWLEVLPLSLSDGLLRLAMVDTTDQDAINQIKFFTGHRVKPMIARLSEIHRGLRSLGATLDVGESGFEGLLRTLGRPPLDLAKLQSKSAASQFPSHLSGVNHARPSSSSASDSGRGMGNGETHSGVSRASSVPAPLDDGFVELLSDNDLENPEKVSDSSSFEEKLNTESASESDIDVSSLIEGLPEETAAPQYRADSTVKDLDELVEATEDDSSLQMQAAEADFQPDGADGDPEMTDTQPFDEIVDDVANENAEASMASAEFTSPGADTIEEVQLASDEQSLSPELSDVLSDGKEPASSGYEPQFEGHEELPAELQPEINLLESTGDAEPGLDFIDSTDSEIETSSHSGIADLNRVLISLQVTTDTARALTKLADVACRVGIIEGAIVMLRGELDLMSVRWSKNGAQSEVYLELPVGHDETSIRAIVDGKDPDVWFEYVDGLAQNITHGLHLRQGHQSVVCLASFAGSANHEGLRQTFADVIRALPVN